MELLRHAGGFALMTLAIDLVPLGMAIVYAVRPTERNLALMRPFTLAGLFAALSGGTMGFVQVLRSIAIAGELPPPSIGAVAAGASESLVTVFVGFASLSVAWLVVAVGMSRAHGEP
jgi:hypothetical protein